MAALLLCLYCVSRNKVMGRTFYSAIEFGKMVSDRIAAFNGIATDDTTFLNKGEPFAMDSRSKFTYIVKQTANVTLTSSSLATCCEIFIKGLLVSLQ